MEKATRAAAAARATKQAWRLRGAGSGVVGARRRAHMRFARAPRNMRCCCCARRYTVRAQRAQHARARGAAITFCCHHLCVLYTYTLQPCVACARTRTAAPPFLPARGWLAVWLPRLRAAAFAYSDDLGSDAPPHALVLLRFCHGDLPTYLCLPAHTRRTGHCVLGPARLQPSTDFCTHVPVRRASALPLRAYLQTTAPLCCCAATPTLVFRHRFPA